MKLKRVVIAATVMALGITSMVGCGSTSANNSTDDQSSGTNINVISREDGSGTRGAFVELFGVEEKDSSGEKIDYTTADATITNSTEVMLTTVAGDENAIGYVSLGSLNDTVKAVKIDGAEATVDNIKDGSYTISRPFNIVTKDKVSGVAQDFINFIMSADGQKVIEDNGYIKVSDAKAFKSDNSKGKVVVAGSSSVSPVMEKLQEAYLAINKNAQIEVQTSDSSTGITSAIDGTCDIGMASRDLDDTESSQGIASTEIALDGIAVIVNNNSAVEDIAKDQVKTIYKGETKTWEEVK